MQQQQRPMRQPPPKDVSQMSNREIEKYLGQQYTQMLVENKETAQIYRDCEEVIQGSMDLLDKYNRIALTIKSKRFGGVLG